jgi:hypothetical protein
LRDQRASIEVITIRLNLNRAASAVDRPTVFRDSSWIFLILVPLLVECGDLRDAGIDDTARVRSAGASLHKPVLQSKPGSSC